MASLRSCFPCRVIRLLSLLLFFGLKTTSVLAAKEDFTWDTVTPEELAETAPKIEADVAAEALLFKVEIDDKFRVLGDVREYHTHQRYKIYDPERAARILSLADYSYASGNKSWTIRARLTLPSGETTEFDEKAFLERTVENKAGQRGLLALFRAKRTEKYLPLTGVERGAVLEIQAKWQAEIPETEIWMLQLPEIPVRKAEYRHWLRDSTRAEFKVMLYGLNGTKLETKVLDQSRYKIASATDLPAIHEEPFSGPANDYSAMTILSTTDKWTRYAYTFETDKKMQEKRAKDARNIFGGPWKVIAWNLNEYASRYADPTGRTKKLAAQICVNATTDEEKARLIHNHVLRMRQKYIAYAQRTPLREIITLASSLNDVLDFETQKRTFSDNDFLMLALALCKTQGLDAYFIALPDRTYFRFNIAIVSWHLFSRYALGIMIDGRWHFSSPHTEEVLPFEMLPMRNLAQVALVAQSAQEFIPIFMPPAELSRVALTGDFNLDSSGTLNGEGCLSLTGYPASDLRLTMRDLDEGARKKAAKEKFLSSNFEATTLEVGHIEGLDGIEEPLKIHFNLTWESYAVRTPNQLILKPSVFRSSAQTPFTASTRITSVVFPFRWIESDEVFINLPNDYTLDAPVGAPQYPGQAINYTLKLGYAQKEHRLILHRDYTVDCTELKSLGYPMLKKLHELIQQSDQNEIVLKAIAPASPATTSAQVEAVAP